MLFACVRSSRPAAFFAVWLVLPLIPLLNLRVFIANDFAHDRYLYLPSVGLAVLVAMLLKKVCWGPPRWLGIPASLLVVVVCLAAVMSYGTVTESFYFKDNLTFYAYNLTRAPHNPDAESNYASLLAEGGQYGPALDAFLDAVNHNPTYWTPTYNLALTYYKMGNMPEAEKYFLQAIRINPNKADEYFYLGMTRFKSGRTAEAIACLRQAMAIHPNGFVYHLALGVMLKTQGDLTGALQEFKEELANNPGEQGAAAQVRRLRANCQRRTEPRPRHGTLILPCGGEGAKFKSSLPGRKVDHLRLTAWPPRKNLMRGFFAADASGAGSVARSIQCLSLSHVGLDIIRVHFPRRVELFRRLRRLAQFHPAGSQKESSPPYPEGSRGPLVESIPPRARSHHAGNRRNQEEHRPRISPGRDSTAL